MTSGLGSTALSQRLGWESVQRFTTLTCNQGSFQPGQSRPPQPWTCCFHSGPDSSAKGDMITVSIPCIAQHRVDEGLLKAQQHPHALPWRWGLGGRCPCCAGSEARGRCPETGGFSRSMRGRGHCPAAAPGFPHLYTRDGESRNTRGWKLDKSSFFPLQK